MSKFRVKCCYACPLLGWDVLGAPVCNPSEEYLDPFTLETEVAPRCPLKTGVITVRLADE